MKRTQNKVAESRKTLPIAIGYGTAIWILAGLFHQQWWIQFACFALAVGTMTELDNHNALMRIYSRMVPVTFICLSCCACFLFPSMSGAIFQLCFIASLYTLFLSYQDRQSTGWTFYTFLLLGLGSVAQPQALWLVLVYWLLMGFTIYSLSWRTFCASVLGVLCPYWFMVAWILFGNDGDFTPFISHLEAVVSYTLPADYASVGLPTMVFAGLTVVLTLVGSLHFVHNSFRDKIRTRQLYYSLMLLFGTATVVLAIKPQHSDVMLRVMIATGSPLIGHFIGLTATRLTNILFYIILTAVGLLTAINLWMPSSVF